MKSPFSLDPRIDRAAFLSMAQEMATLAADWIDGEASGQVLDAGRALKLSERLNGASPRLPGDWQEILQVLRHDVFPGLRRNGSPRFFGYVCASAEPVAALADFLASAINQNVTAWRSAPAATTIEKQVINWIDEAIGFAGGHGLLVGGGSAANFNGLLLAIEKKASDGGARREAMTVYVSMETHLSFVKAATTLGIAAQHVRVIDCADDSRIDMQALRQTIIADQAAGLCPTAMIATAGTVNTGAIDPIPEMAALAQQLGLWLHIDGAYGAPLALTERHAELRSWFRLADSMSIDPHKWLFVPLDMGCFLCRHEELSRRVFTSDADYVRDREADDLEGFAFFDHGMELSRRFRALKLWLMLRFIGLDRIAEAITANVELRHYLDRRVTAEPELEALGSGASVACFRRVLPGVDDVDELNRQILADLVESGRFLLSPTKIRGAFALRVCIVNFRSRKSDIDELLERVLGYVER